MDVFGCIGMDVKMHIIYIICASVCGCTRSVLWHARHTTPFLCAVTTRQNAKQLMPKQKISWKSWDLKGIVFRRETLKVSSTPRRKPNFSKVWAKESKDADRVSQENKLINSTSCWQELKFTTFTQREAHFSFVLNKENCVSLKIGNILTNQIVRDAFFLKNRIICSGVFSCLLTAFSPLFSLFVRASPSFEADAVW